MVGWFKKKKAEDVPLEVEQFYNKHFGPTVLVARTIENIRTYFKRIEVGEISFPAYRRKGSNVLQVWIDTQWELLSCLWKYLENFNPAVLAERTRQKELLEFIKEADIKRVRDGAQLKYALNATSPNKELKNMLDAIILMYQTSLNISYEVGVVTVEEAMGYEPKVKRGLAWAAMGGLFQERDSTVGIKDFLEVANKASADWLHFCNKLDSHEPLPSYPKTIFEIIFEDITKKSKIIVLTALFGPTYGKTHRVLIEEIEEKRIKDGLSLEATKEQQEIFDYLINASKPEDVIKWMTEKKIGPYREG